MVFAEYAFNNNYYTPYYFADSEGQLTWAYIAAYTHTLQSESVTNVLWIFTYMFCALYITLCKSTHRFQFDNGLHEWLQYCVYAILINV